MAPPDPTPPAGPRTHYQVLGVRPVAGRDEIRTAHRQLAHLLHPDRLAGASDAERALGERRMREVNAAWAVLSDPARRADYDRSLTLRPATRAGAGARPGPGTTTAGARTAATGRQGEDPRSSHDAAGSDDPDAALARLRAAEVDPDEPDLSPAHFWLLRRGPLVAVLAVAAVLFVATAYAGSGARGGAGTEGRGTTAAPALATGSGGCVQENADRVGIRVDCGGPNDGTIVTTVRRVQDCPQGTRYVSLTPDFVCVRGGQRP